MITPLLCALLLPPGPNSVSGERARFNFNIGWRLTVGDPADAPSPAFSDANWQPVTLPRAWNEDAAYRVSIHDQPTGIAWYRKRFRLPKVAPGSRIYLEFEGARLAAEVFLNGKRLGLSENGVMAFGFDLTPFLRAGENVLAVRTDNRWDYRERATNTPIQWNNNNFFANYGGLNKNVWLHVTPSFHQTLPLYSSLGTTGRYIWADQFDLQQRSARIHVESQVRNASPKPQVVRLQSELIDARGKRVARWVSYPGTIAPGALRTFATVGKAKSLNLWSWGYGSLYDVRTTLLIGNQTIDSVTTQTGFRKTEFRDGQVFLNGRSMMIHGYAARTTNEWPGLGVDIPPWLSDYSNGLMVEGNANLVRWMHVTPSKQDVESCDRVGLPQAMPAADSEGDPDGRRWEARVEVMRDAIVYNRNNPSILFYESGNKGIRESHMADMLAVKRTFDPHGGRVIGSREMLGSKTAEYGGEMLYINKSAAKPLWAHEYNRDEGARKFWDDLTPPFHKDSPAYNRNQDSFTVEDVIRWDEFYRARPGTGRRVSAGGVNISWIDENSHHRGDNNYRRSGEVDAMRIPKDAFYAHQVMWDGWVEPERPRIHLSGHWNYPAGTVKPVRVIANVPEVELRLNGRSLGFRRPTHDFLFTFESVRFQPGRLVAIGYDAQRKPITKADLVTTGAPVRLQLTPITGPAGLRADGSDVALVQVEAVDQAGRRVPTALPTVDFRLEGPAEWRGGIAQGSREGSPANDPLKDDNFILSPSLPLEGGVNRVLLRSTRIPGTIRIVATAAGFPAAMLTLRSSPVLEKEGLSTFNPSAGLSPRLERGPTPATPSVVTRRRSIPIAGVSTRVNAAEGANSFDDDETTSWSNAITSAVGETIDGFPPKNPPTNAKPATAKLEDAWIEFQLAEPAIPTEIELKLAAFRLRRYPFRISLDGEVIFEGTTGPSLGYVNLPLRPTKPGRTLRIELTAPAFSVDESKPLVELNGKVDQAEARKTNRTPVLNLIEVDIYRRP